MACARAFCLSIARRFCFSRGHFFIRHFSQPPLFAELDSPTKRKRNRSPTKSPLKRIVRKDGTAHAMSGTGIAIGGEVYSFTSAVSTSKLDVRSSPAAQALTNQHDDALLDFAFVGTTDFPFPFDDEDARMASCRKYRAAQDMQHGHWNKILRFGLLNEYCSYLRLAYGSQVQLSLPAYQPCRCAHEQTHHKVICVYGYGNLISSDNASDRL